MGASGGYHRRVRPPPGAGGAARRARRLGHHFPRSVGPHGLRGAAVPVPWRHEPASRRDSLRPLRAPDRTAARRPLRAARARGEKPRRRRAHAGLQEEGRRMTKELLAQDPEKMNAAAAQTPRAGTAKPIPDDAMILIPMRNTVLFPGVITPVTVGRPSSVAAAQEAVRSERKVGFLLQKDSRKNAVTADDLYWVGTAGQIVRYITGGEGAHHMVVQGQSRFRALEFLEGWPFLVARVQYIEQPEEKEALPRDLEARFLQLKAQAVEAIELLPNAPEELAVVVQGMTSPALLADMVGNLLDVKLEDKQALLETFDLRARLDKVLQLLGERVGVLRISKEIGDKTKKEFDSRQREHVLREQLRQI